MPYFAFVYPGKGSAFFHYGERESVFNDRGRAHPETRQRRKKRPNNCDVHKKEPFSGRWRRPRETEAGGRRPVEAQQALRGRVPQFPGAPPKKGGRAIRGKVQFRKPLMRRSRSGRSRNFFVFPPKKVAADMALSKWKGKRISRRTAFRISRRRGIKFRAMRERPVLTKEDVVQRFAFSRKFGGRRARFWDQTVAIDGKRFALALTARRRR